MKEKNQDKNKNETKLFYDKIIKSNALMKFLSGKENIRVATAMIYERIGETEYFLGGYPLLRGKYHQIGEYYVLDLPGKPYFIDCLGSEVFTPAKDSKIKKIVEIIKYSDDDYRIRRKLDSTFYKKEKIIKYSEEPVALTDENEQVILDDEGEPIMVKVPLRDKENNVIYEEITKAYTEPKGVTQEGRDAIRIHNQTNEEIKKFKERSEGFWTKFNKHGGMTVVGLAIVVMAMLMMGKMMTDSWTEGVQTLSNDIKESNKNMQWWQQPDALDKIGQAVAKTNDEKNAPPVT